MNHTSEVDKMLEKQKSKAAEIKQEKLLLLDSTTDEFQAIKEKFGFNDTDRVLQGKESTAIELAEVMSSSKQPVITEEYIADFCLKNNYVICKLEEYKGRLTNEMLGALKQYSEETGESLHDTRSFYIMCRFSDLTADNSDLNKSKRYKGRFYKVILLHRIDKNNKYTMNHYKVISEQGELDKLDCFVKSLYKTHSKTKNFFNSLLGVLLITLLYILVFSLCTFLLKNPAKYIMSSVTEVVLLAGVLFLFFRTILPIVTGGKEAAFNIYNDNGYQNWSNDLRDKFLSFYLYNTQAINPKYINTKTIILKNQIYYWCLILSYVIIFYGGLHILRISYIGSNEPVKIVTKCEVAKYAAGGIKERNTTYDIYTKNGALRYSKETITVLEKLK